MRGSKGNCHFPATKATTMQRATSTTPAAAAAAVELPSKKPATNGSALFMSALAARTTKAAPKAATAAPLLPPPSSLDVKGKKEKRAAAVTFSDSEEEDDGTDGDDAETKKSKDGDTEEEEDDTDEGDDVASEENSAAESEEDALAAAIAAAAEPVMSIDEANGYPRIPDVDLPTPAASDDEEHAAAAAATAAYAAAVAVEWDEEGDESTDPGVAALMKARRAPSSEKRKQNVAHAHIRRLLHTKCPKISTLSFDGGKTDVNLAEFLTTCELDRVYTGYNKQVGNVHVRIAGPHRVEPGKKAPAGSFRRPDADSHREVFTSQFGFGSCKTFCKEWERAFIAALIKDSASMSTAEAEKRMDEAYAQHLAHEPEVSDVVMSEVVRAPAHKSKRRRVAVTAAVVEPGDSDTDATTVRAGAVTKEDVAKFLDVGGKILMQLLGVGK